jgi:hypothetical protein
MMSEDHSIPAAIFSVGQTTALDDAFMLLARAVADLSQQGTPIKAAAVKPRMRQLSLSGFNEQDFNYESFRAFLEDAAERGVISLDTETHQDYLVTPAAGPVRAAGIGAPQVIGIPRSGAAPARPAERRVRQDLWNAFVDWRKGLIRLYDRQTGQICMFTGEAVPGEPERTTAQRTAWREDPHRFVQIPPVTFNDQVGWMRAFAQDLHRSELNDVLRAGFDSDRPAAIFRSAIRAFPDVDRDWRNYLLAQVVARIKEWAAREHVDINPFSPPPAPALGRKIQERASQPNDGDSHAAALRARLHAAIDAMPLHELLQLRIPVGYLL